MEFFSEGDYLSETLESPGIVEAQLSTFENENGSRAPMGFPVPTLSHFVDLGNLLLDVADLDEAALE